MVENAKKNARWRWLVLAVGVLVVANAGMLAFVGFDRALIKSKKSGLLEYGAWNEELAVGLKDLPGDEELAAWVEELFEVKSIPVVNLTTEVEVKDDYEYYDLVMSISDDKTKENNYKDLRGGIRTRGNSTYKIGLEYGAMPYKIKLDDGVDLLGMGAGKKWCLIANFIDRSYVKQFIMYQTAQLMMGEGYFQPEAKYVEVYMNGEYKGLYLLTESIEEDEGRLGLEVDLAAEEENMPFLLEMEYRDYLCEERYREQVESDFSNTKFFADSWERMPTWLLDDEEGEGECGYTPYMLQYPKNFDDMSDEQELNLRYTLYDMFESAELGLSIGELGLDMNSFVNYYLFMEVFSNPTFVGPSVFMYREAGASEVKMGPLWDFDTAMFGGTDGSVNLEKNTLYKYLYEYKGFRGALADRYEEFAERLFPLLAESIEGLGENEILKAAVARAEEKYNTWGRSLNGYNGFPAPTYDIPDPTILSLGSLDAHVEHILGWLFEGYDDVRGYSLEGRTVWLGENLGRWRS